MRVPTGAAEIVYETQKSRFLAKALPVDGAEAARSLLKALKAEYAEAAHVVHAFCVGTENSLTTGYSDDGEPPGTAGRPLMEVLGGSGVTNLLIAVVRWFGGIKLGTGGLVKAYSEAGKLVLAALPTREYVELVPLNFELEYPEYEAFRRRLGDWEVAVQTEEFGASIRLGVELPVQRRTDLETFLRDLTRGKIKFGSSG